MSIRTRRVGNEIQRIISSLLTGGEIHDPRLKGMVTITQVDVSPDLRNAVVYYSCFGSPEEREDTKEGLESASGFIQSRVGDELRARYTPKLRFERDDSIAYGDHMEQVISEVVDTDETEDESEE